METSTIKMGTNIVTLKQEISKLATEQVVLKNQRKTVNLVGTRSLNESEAAYRHSSNRYHLRRLYLTLGLLKGRTIEQIEGCSKQPLSESSVKHLLEKYG